MSTRIPSTSEFPANVGGLERESLEASYLHLRKSYNRLMISRGRYRGISEKSGEKMAALSERLRTIAEREASVRAEAYEMLEIVTNVIGELEDAGDDLVNEFDSYQKGRKIARLARAPVHSGNSMYMVREVVRNLYWCSRQLIRIF